MKKLILTAALLLSTAAQAQVPTFTSSGDLSSVTRHSFRTGQIINPKSWPDFAHNNSLNAANGLFTTGSQAWHTAGSYVFTIPPGFTKLEVIGCGAGGQAQQNTWWSGNRRWRLRKLLQSDFNGSVRQPVFISTSSSNRHYTDPDFSNSK